MEREPLSSEADALWRRLWEIWQDNDEEDVVLDSGELADLEEEIPVLENRMKTALAYLQRARYIQYRSGVGEEGIAPILYDVYEPRGAGEREERDLATIATRGASRGDGRPHTVRHQQPAAPGRRRPCTGRRAVFPRRDRDPLRYHGCRAPLGARARAHYERALVDVARRVARRFLRVRLDSSHPPPRGGDDRGAVPGRTGHRLHNHRPLRPVRHHRATGQPTAHPGRAAHHRRGGDRTEVLRSPVGRCPSASRRQITACK